MDARQHTDMRQKIGVHRSGEEDQIKNGRSEIRKFEDRGQESGASWANQE
jgi:hypothetical protein